MPGIAGIIGTGAPGENENRLREMLKCMMHEEFYSSGTYINEQLDLWVGWVTQKGSFSARNPIWNEKKDVCLIFSGEEFADLHAINSLRLRGHNFESGDASYLVHLYEEMGSGCIEKLNGRFSGVIVDLRQQNALLFNDRYGLNRIYFYENSSGFFFSSEAKSLLRVLPELRRLDPTGLAETFSCGSVLQNRTLYTGISLVPGGAAWSFIPKQHPRKMFYFRPNQWEDQASLSPSEYYEKLKTTWARILPRYLRGPNQVAMSLTGGKDSRLIMAWAHAQPGALPCYTFGGIYRDCQDVKLARQVAKVCRQPHEVITVDRAFLREFPNLAERTVYLTDGILDVSASPDLYVNRRARQIAPVRLTGNYGQEILRGDIAFKPRPMSMAILEKGFSRLVADVQQTYQSELKGNRLSFIAFKQVPWHHYSRLALELSQLTLRSPFLDNELVSLCYQAPDNSQNNIGIQLRLIKEGNAELAKIDTDRALLYQSTSSLNWIKHKYQEVMFKAEYAFDYGMPQALAYIDHLTCLLYTSPSPRDCS